jgi:hypothetical protein
MNLPSLESIEKLLKAGALEQKEARRRAPLVFEDFEWIGFKSLRLGARPSPLCSPFCIPEYHFGNTGFSVDYAEQAKEIKSEWIGGTGLDRGHLQLFSRVSLIARELLPDIWHKSGKLRHCLRDPAQHLNTVEEICWLDRWRAPKNIESSKNVRSDANTDVDWQFCLGEDPKNQIVVNLEVKRLIGDVLRHVRGRSFKPEWFERFCFESVIPKFKPSQEYEVNVLALSLFGEINRDVQMVIGEWLGKHQGPIDAVLVSSRESRRRSCFDWHFRSQKAAKMKGFLKEPSPEEQSWIFDLLVPIDFPGIPSIVKP